MDYPPFFHHPGISAAKDPAPHLLGLEKREEDDVDLYAELWQQILQLTSDEDDNPAGSKNQGPCPVAAAPPPPVSCFDWRMINMNVELSPPAWLLSPPRSASGTGVFIPSAAATGRGHNRGIGAKKKKKKAKKQVENK
ncbi:uncharacterized protein LOC130136138 [Syzygium oleosum]|uniref:uncharacterized protein LOC130136138 n=1 Tax=Syzygium oleosum TaxID=219896 RepID=UPI0024B901B7|nr:uncharacterized protein LOC130136138 [Syzygium oleosum]